MRLKGSLAVTPHEPKGMTGERVVSSAEETH
jgi:hypothetical protein